MIEVLQAVNPDEPDTEFLVGAQALSQGDRSAFASHLERALASGAKHNHMLLQYYAQSLLDRGADWQEVNSAVNRWRQNHPLSSERLSGIVELPGDSGIQFAQPLSLTGDTFAGTATLLVDGLSERLPPSVGGRGVA